MSKDYFNDLIEKTLRLVAINSVQDAPCSISPFGNGVGLCLLETEKICKEFGFKTHNEEGYYITASIGNGEEFGILGHVDTVPFDAKAWSVNPLGEIKNNILYGRGVLDDKGPMLACLVAVKELLDLGYKPKYKIKFIFGGNEESGWKCIERFNQKEKMPQIGISPDADFPVINCEKGIVEITSKIKKPSSLCKIKGGSRSNVVIGECNAVVNGILPAPKDINVSIEHSQHHTYIKALGQAAHGSTPNKGDNAFHHILNYLAQYNPSEYLELSKKLCHITGEGLNLKLHDTVSGDLTFNVGVVKDNNDYLEIVMDIRYPITYTKEKILEIVKSNLSQDSTITHFHDPLYVAKDDPLVECLLKAYTKVTQQKAEPITIGGGTYARALPHGVAFGPIFPDQESTIHQIDERVSLIDFEKAYNVYFEALKMLFN